MSKKYRLVIFDWEGTLGDSLGQIVNCIITEAKNLNFGNVSIKDIQPWLNFGIVKTIKKAFPNLSMDQHNKLLGAIQKSLAYHSFEEQLIPGGREIVEELFARGITLAIATNRSCTSLQRILNICKLNHLFATIRCAGQTPAKPCPQMINEILEELDIKTDEAIMIGDSLNDIEMAKHAGVDSLGMDFYRQQHQSLQTAGALKVFDNYREVAQYLGLTLTS